MNNVLIDTILRNIETKGIADLIGTEDVRDTKGKKMKSFNGGIFYLSIKRFCSYSNLVLHSGVMTSFLHSTMPDCCIVRMTRNVSYVLLRLEDGRIDIVKQGELKGDLLEEYARRSKQ